MGVREVETLSLALSSLLGLFRGNDPEDAYISHKHCQASHCALNVRQSIDNECAVVCHPLCYLHGKEGCITSDVRAYLTKSVKETRSLPRS